MIPKIYECLGNDHLSPIFSYALVTKKKTVATNAHVLIAHNTRELFGKQFVNDLPSVGILLDYNVLKDMAKKDVTEIRLNGQIEVTHQPRKTSKETVTSFFTYQTEEKLGTNFPDWEAVMPEKNENDPPVCIGINAKLLLVVQNALGPDNIGVKCYFSGTNKAILCEPFNTLFESAIGIVMPLMFSV